MATIARYSADERLLYARVMYWLWQVVSKIGFGIVYLNVMVHGMQRLAPATSVKLLKFRGHRVTSAQIMCLFVLLGVWFSWSMILRLWLGEEDVFKHSWWTTRRHMLFIVTFGLALILADATIFYLSIADWQWSGTSFSFTSLMATVTFSTVLILMEYRTLVLERRVDDLRKEN